MKTKFLKLGVVLLLLGVVFAGCEKNNNGEKNEYCHPVLGWGVKFTLKSTIDIDLPITELPEIKALIDKHDIMFYQSMPGAINPNLLLYYTLTGKDCDTMYVVIKEFLATSLFEDDFRFFEIAHTNQLNCQKL